MSSFALYIIGFIILIIGLVVGANLLGLDQRWIWIGAIILIGIGILSGVSKTRGKDIPPPEA